MKGRNRKVRAASLLVIVCMMTTLLIACTKDNNSNSSSGTESPASSNSANETTSENVDQWALPYKGEEVTIKLLGWESFKPFDPSTEFGKWVQEQIGNIKLEFEIPAEGTETKADLYLASNDMPDLMVYRDAAKFMKNYGDGSRALNLANYMNYMPEYSKRLAENPHLQWFSPDEKTNYLFLQTSYNSSSEVWYQNQDLMDKYKIKTPTNYTEMVQAMATVHQAEPDTVGVLQHPWGFGYQFMNYAMLFGGNGWPASDIAYDYNTNKWDLNLFANSDAFLNTVKAMNEAYKNGYLHPEFSTMSDDVYNNIRNNGKWLFSFNYPYNASEMGSTIKVNPVYIDPPAANGVKPMVRTDYQSDTTGWMTIVNKDTKYPELCALLLEFFSSQKYAETYYWGFEGETYQIGADGKKSYIDAYEQLPSEEKQSKYGLTVPYAVTQLVSLNYVGDAMAAAWSDASKNGVKTAAEKLKSGDYSTYYRATVPNFSEEDNQKMSVITTAVSTYITETLTQFVLGNKSIDEWESFIADVPKYGDVNWAVEKHNTAEQKPLRPKGTERTWLMP